VAKLSFAKNLISILQNIFSVHSIFKTHKLHINFKFSNWLFGQGGAKKKNFKISIVDKTAKNARFIDFFIVNLMGIMFWKSE
jgi:hypothetical protein